MAIINKFGLYLADLGDKNPRPVLVVQSDIINDYDPHSYLVISLSDKDVKKENTPLSLYCKNGDGGLTKDYNIIMLTTRSIDANRIRTYIGKLPKQLREEVDKRLKIIFDLE